MLNFKVVKIHLPILLLGRTLNDILGYIVDTGVPIISRFTSEWLTMHPLLLQFNICTWIAQLIRSEKDEHYFEPKSEIVVNFKNLIIVTFSKISQDLGCSRGKIEFSIEMLANKGEWNKIHHYNKNGFWLWNSRCRQIHKQLLWFANGVHSVLLYKQQIRDRSNF